MATFSIELAADRIVDARTRTYFEEVLRCYNSNCLRSAVVMLWSVVVADLLFKLDQLSVAYSDSTATSILSDVEKLRKANPKSPEWEWTLVEKIKKRTQLLDDAEHVNLQSLQQHRHLCAHPIITSSEVLFSPTREVVRAHIRNALDGVLTKPSVFSKKVFDALTEDLEEHSAIFPDQESLRRYLSAKYFPHFVADIENSVFRSLWRLTFKSADQRCENARDIFYRTLQILFDRRPAEIRDEIEKDRDYFSELAAKGTPLQYFARFIGKYPQVFSTLTDAAKAPLQAFANTSLSNFANCWFMNDTAEQHLAEIERRVREEHVYMSGESFARMFQVAEEAGLSTRAIDIGILHYIGSRNFDTADGYFGTMIDPHVDKMSSGQLLVLLEGIEANAQTHARGKAKKDHQKINAAVVKVIGSSFNPAHFPSFIESLK